MKTSILKEVARLDQLPTSELQHRWRELFDREPPRYNRKHLIQRLAHRLQELHFGGLSQAIHRTLKFAPRSQKDYDAVLDYNGVGGRELWRMTRK